MKAIHTIFSFFQSHLNLGVNNKRFNGSGHQSAKAASVGLGGGKTPAQQRLRQPQQAATASSSGVDPVQKLKGTVLQLESTLSKRNKEIVSLKKQANGGGGTSPSLDFTGLAKKVEGARAKNKGQDTRLRVQTIVKSTSGTCFHVYHADKSMIFT